MIYGVFGLPGSGKSYYVIKEFVVNRIVSNTIVSNIKLSDDIEAPENYIYLEKNDLDNLHKNIKTILEKDGLSHDDKKELLRVLFGLYNGHNGDITFIIDEAHLYGYRGRSINIAWADDFLSIHRHIFKEIKIDVVLVTQVPSRLNKEISGQIEVSVQAIPASQRMVKSMLEYSVYGSVASMIAKDSTMRMKRQIIRGDKNVFSLYQSGFVQEGSNDFRRKMYLIVAGLLLVMIFTYSRFSALISSNSNKILSNDTVTQKLAANSKDTNVTDKFYESYDIVCRSVPKSFNVSQIKDYFYVLEHSQSYEICYKKYIGVTS